MPSVIVDITIDADEYLKYYQTPGVVVYATSRSGKSVQFPANLLQPYVTHGGVRGSFKIQFDSAGKFQSIEKL